MLHFGRDHFVQPLRRAANGVVAQIAYESAELSRPGAPRNRDVRPKSDVIRRPCGHLKIEPAAGLAASQAWLGMRYCLVVAHAAPPSHFQLLDYGPLLIVLISSHKN